MKKIYLMLFSAFALQASAQTLKLQSFEGLTTDTWNYSIDPAAFNVSGDVWDTVSSLGSVSNVPTDGTTFFGVQDLDNSNGGTTGYGKIMFDTVQLSSSQSYYISFDYDVVGFDNGDDVEYELWVNGVSQDTVLLVDGYSNFSANGTEYVTIPASTDSIRFEVRVIQNGGSDYAGFDNFQVVAGTVPTTTTPTIPFYPIADINNVDANGVADSLNVQCWTKGIAIGVNLRPSGLQFALWDNEGITVFNYSGNVGYTVNEGDSLEILGTVDQFNGLIEFIPDSIVVVNSNNTLPTPSVVTTLDETTESNLIKIENVVYVSSSMLVSGTDTFGLYIDSDTDVNDSLSLSAGDSLCYIIGIGTQYDGSTPYTSGYQITPRYYTDIDTSCNAVDTTTPPAVVIPTYDIEVLRTVDTDYIVDSLGVYCAVEGIVHGVNLQPGGLGFTVIDETDGIYIFNYSSDLGYTVEEGDEVRVVGTVANYNGLVELEADSLTVLSTDNCIPFPTIVDELSEATESNYIELRNVSIVPGQNWASAGYNANIDIITENGDTVIMRLDKDALIADSITSAPSGTFTLVGIGGQYDSSTPHDEGYQIFPQYVTDFDTVPHPAPAGLVINELMASNDSDTTDEAGDNEDWFELFNGGSTDLDLAGYFVTDDASEMLQYRIPRCNTETTITAGGWKLFWADGDDEDGPLHTNFGLSGSGEYLALYTQDGTVVDSVTFGAATADVSYGRRQDGDAEWVEFEVTTPDASNNNGVVLSVSDVNNKPAFVAYPNPVSGSEIYFNYAVDVTVYNTVGQLVETGKQVQSLNVDSYKNGVYFIRTNEGEVVRMVVR